MLDLHTNAVHVLLGVAHQGGEIEAGELHKAKEVGLPLRRRRFALELARRRPPDRRGAQP